MKTNKTYIVVTGRGPAEIKIVAEFSAQQYQGGSAKRMARSALRAERARNLDARLVCFRERVPQEIQHAQHRVRLERRIRGAIQSLVQLHRGPHADPAYRDRLTRCLEGWLDRQDDLTIRAAVAGGAW